MNKSQKQLSRRNFIRLSAITAALSGSTFKANSEPVFAPRSVDDKSHFMDKGTRLSIAMWDYSWINAHHKGGSFESLQQRVAEAAERGFNTMRIDCLPSRILEGKSIFKKNFTPGSQLPVWGQCVFDHEENVLKKLAELANYCRKYNIWLGLYSWEKGHMFAGDNVNPDGISYTIKADEEEKTFRGFSNIWVKALKQMREEGILERAVWIAPMNEVPHFGSRSVQFIKDTNSGIKNEGETKLETDQKINNKYRQINHWIGEAIKDETLREKIPLSYSSLGAEEYNKRLTDIYDVVDVHFMPPVVMDKTQTAALSKLERGGAGFEYFEKMEDLKEFSKLWDTACKANYASMLIQARDYFKMALKNLTLSSGKKLQSIITESFGPCYWPDHKDVSWDWYKMYNADALRIAASMPFNGLSLSNYSEPLFSLWDDVDWHRNSNLFTLNIL